MIIWIPTQLWDFNLWDLSFLIYGLYDYNFISYKLTDTIHTIWNTDLNIVIKVRFNSYDYFNICLLIFYKIVDKSSQNTNPNSDYIQN